MTNERIFNIDMLIYLSKINRIYNIDTLIYLSKINRYTISLR
jgi:hypothetical protein